MLKISLCYSQTCIVGIYPLIFRKINSLNLWNTRCTFWLNSLVLCSFAWMFKAKISIYCQIEKWEKFVVMSCFSQHNGFWTLKKFLLDVRLVKVSRVLLWCYWERKFLQSCLLYYIYTDQVDVREDGFGFFFVLFI